MRVSIHNVKKLIVGDIKLNYLNDGRKFYTRNITIKNGEGSFDLELFSDDRESLRSLLN